MKIESIDKLIKSLQKERFVYIQPHNYPDHDAIASAYGLQYLFEQFGVESKIVYQGNIERNSLKQMIKKLSIKTYQSYPEMSEKDKIVIVDGCKGNKNVTDLIGDEVAVIDHHQVNKKDLEDISFIDIRNQLGSCSSIIASYFDEMKIEIPSKIATAFMIGLNMDTSNLTRGLHSVDLHYFTKLYFKSNIDFVQNIIRNFSTFKDLKHYALLIDNLETKDNVAFCYFHDGCSINTLGILADFVLALEEIDLVVLCAKNIGKINFSSRNEAPEWNSSLIVQELLKGIGSGGGHCHMAGGTVLDAHLFDPVKVRDKLLKLTLGEK